MNKQPSLNSIGHMGESGDNALLDWLSAYKQYILLSILVLFGIIVLTYRFVSAHTLKAEGDFLQAQMDFSRFQNVNGNNTAAQTLENLTKLETILTTYPELQAKYDALIAQTLIIDQDPNQASTFAERTFKRVKNESIELYHRFAQTSLLISEGKYEQALLETEQLQKSFETAPAEEFGTTLTTFNLIRLAFLYQHLNKKNEEIQIWNQLMSSQSTPEIRSILQQLFNEGNVLLNSYIDARKAAS